jgi:hypothetical protein
MRGARVHLAGSLYCHYYIRLRKQLVALWRSIYPYWVTRTTSVVSSSPRTFTRI